MRIKTPGNPIQKLILKGPENQSFRTRVNKEHAEKKIKKSLKTRHANPIIKFIKNLLKKLGMLWLERLFFPVTQELKKQQTITTIPETKIKQQEIKIIIL